MNIKIKQYTIFLQTIFALLVLRLFLIREPIIALYQIGFIIVLELILFFVKSKTEIDKIRLFAWTLVIIHEIGILGPYSLPDFATLMHGLWGGFLGFIFTKMLKKRKLSNNQILLLIIVIVLMIGIAWEMVEFSWDLLFEPNSSFGKAQLSIVDTIVDLITNIAGAIIGWFISIKN
jgi:glycopeptide antibiotics resistance protein